MEESLERELMRASRNGKPLALLFIDLDHFKRFNDSFGHDAGDFVLRTMANVFRDFFRGNDLICRYGGEEFAIGLPECNAHDAAARADELRARPEHSLEVRKPNAAARHIVSRRFSISGERFHGRRCVASRR